MKYRWQSTKWILSTVLVMFMVAFSIPASNDCFTWDDPQCQTSSTTMGICGGCGAHITLTVTDHGTHWVCTPVEKGWLTCPTDTPCHYTAAGTCVYCQFYTVVDKTGANDQLVDGGDCPPPQG
jgi:hypothetical protein